MSLITHPADGATKSSCPEILPNSSMAIFLLSPLIGFN